MRANQKLINAMLSVAAKIRAKPKIYDWFSSTSCNCGLLAQELGLSKKEIYTNSKGSWRQSAEICSQTGLETSRVFTKLSRAGLDFEDFEQIEYLGNKKDSESDYSDPLTVANWFEKKAAELQKELDEYFTQLKPVPRTNPQKDLLQFNRSVKRSKTEKGY